MQLRKEEKCQSWSTWTLGQRPQGSIREVLARHSVSWYVFIHALTLVWQVKRQHRIIRWATLVVVFWNNTRTIPFAAFSKNNEKMSNKTPDLAHDNFDKPAFVIMDSSQDDENTNNAMDYMVTRFCKFNICRTLKHEMNKPLKRCYDSWMIFKNVKV